MKHLESAELIEHYYLPTVESGAGRHLGSCPTCSAAFEALRRELSTSIERHHEVLNAMGDDFWSGQRKSITAAIQARQEHTRPVRWYAAAAIIVSVLSGSLVYRNVVKNDMEVAPRSMTQQVNQITTTAAATEVAVISESSTDPWQSEELSSYQELVDWESWSDEESKGRKES